MSKSKFGRLHQLLDEVKSEMDKMSPALKDQLGRSFHEVINSIEHYNDLSNKQAVYQAVAKFLERQFSRPFPVCLAAVYRLCGETNPYFVAALPRQTYGTADAVASLTESARNLILGVKAYYEKSEAGSHLRRTEVWFAEKGKPTAFTLEERVEWDDLPADVRESFLCDGASLQVFKVYPKE